MIEIPDLICLPSGEKIFTQDILYISPILRAQGTDVTYVCFRDNENKEKLVGDDAKRLHELLNLVGVHA